MTGFSAIRWLNHFTANQSNRPLPAWDAPITLAPALIPVLVHSLEQFQLGDGGGPADLIAFNAQQFRSTGDQTDRLVDLWFLEEEEHARLLQGLLDRFGGTPIQSHWSFSLFCSVRRWGGVRFELTALLLTEIASTIYYRLLLRYGRDPALRDVCRLILRDEAGHVAFHRDRMAHAPAAEWRYGRIWETVFRGLGLAAATMLWVNHAPALTALGATTRDFYQRVWRELGVFIAHLRRDATANAITRTLVELHQRQLCSGRELGSPLLLSGSPR
jgi:hypothetical protein